MTIKQTRALMEAIIQRDEQAAGDAITGGADPNAVLGGTRPLHMAAITGSSQMVRMLTKNGALPDGPDSLGRTALHYAAMGSPEADTDLVDTLINQGADPNVSDANGCSPLDIAAAVENLATAVPLHKAGATCKEDRRGWVQRASGTGSSPGSSGGRGRGR